MVRDPIERVISWYYYVRAPWYFVERKRAFPDLPLPNPNWLRKVTKLFKHLICTTADKAQYNKAITRCKW